MVNQTTDIRPANQTTVYSNWRPLNVRKINTTTPDDYTEQQYGVTADLSLHGQKSNTTPTPVQYMADQTTRATTWPTKQQYSNGSLEDDEQFYGRTYDKL